VALRVAMPYTQALRVAMPRCPTLRPCAWPHTGCRARTLRLIDMLSLPSLIAHLLVRGNNLKPPSNFSMSSSSHLRLAGHEWPSPGQGEQYVSGTAREEVMSQTRRETLLAPSHWGEQTLGTFFVRLPGVWLPAGRNWCIS
jgi:hypothetical protein